MWSMRQKKNGGIEQVSDSKQVSVNQRTLVLVLGKMFSSSIVFADIQVEQLHGGTLGDVRLVTGMAETADGDRLPYRVVWKTQRRWERPGDPASWRREYDLYLSDLGRAFADSLRWPECYYLEMDERETEIQMWMEYIDGVSGNSLTVDMLEQAALELGRFQGRHFATPDDLREIGCLGDSGFMEREFRQWHAQTFAYGFLVSEQCRIPEFLKQMLRKGDIQLVDGKSFEYSCLRSRGCTIPEHLKQMLVDIDERQTEIFDNIRRLPIVLCHRDFWIENIFAQNGKIRLIDWDTAGWGYVGEDIASLIIDETDVSCIEGYYRRLIPAYREGLSEYMDLSQIEDLHIREMILLKFGYRILREYMFSLSPDVKEDRISLLQKIYEMRAR